MQQIIKQLQRTIQVAGSGNTTTTTTTLPLVFRDDVGAYFFPKNPCNDPAFLPDTANYYISQDCFDNLTVGCYLYTDEMLTPASEGYYVGWTEGVDYFYVNSEGQVVNINICPQPR